MQDNTAAGGALADLPDHVLPRAVALAVLTGGALALTWRLGRLRSWSGAADGRGELG